MFLSPVRKNVEALALDKRQQLAILDAAHFMLTTV